MTTVNAYLVENTFSPYPSTPTGSAIEALSNAPFNNLDTSPTQKSNKIDVLVLSETQLLQLKKQIVDGFETLMKSNASLTAYDTDLRDNLAKKYVTWVSKVNEAANDFMLETHRTDVVSPVATFIPPHLHFLGALPAKDSMNIAYQAEIAPTSPLGPLLLADLTELQGALKSLGTKDGQFFASWVSNMNELCKYMIRTTIVPQGLNDVITNSWRSEPFFFPEKQLKTSEPLYGDYTAGVGNVIEPFTDMSGSNSIFGFDPKLVMAIIGFILVVKYISSSSGGRAKYPW